MDGHPLILLKHGGPSRKKASLYGKVAQIYFALRGSFLLCAQHDGMTLRDWVLIPFMRGMSSSSDSGNPTFLLTVLIPFMRGMSSSCRLLCEVDHVNGLNPL